MRRKNARNIVTQRTQPLPYRDLGGYHIQECTSSPEQVGIRIRDVGEIGKPYAHKAFHGINSKSEGSRSQ